MSEAWVARCRQILPATVGPSAPDLAALLARHNPRWGTLPGPQGYWSAGAPLGNGDFGAMAYGPPENLTLALGKNDLWWRPTTASHFPPGSYADLLRLYQTQDQAAWDRLLPKDPAWADNFAPSSLIGGGHLRLHLAEAGQVRAWRQELCLRTATCRWQWEAPGLDRMWSPKEDFTLEAFLSAPHEVLVLRLRRARARGSAASRVVAAATNQISSPPVS